MSQGINDDYENFKKLRQEKNEEGMFTLLKEVAKKNGYFGVQRPNYYNISDEFECSHVYFHYGSEQLEFVLCPQGSEVIEHNS